MFCYYNPFKQGVVTVYLPASSSTMKTVCLLAEKCGELHYENAVPVPHQENGKGEWRLLHCGVSPGQTW